MSNQLSFFGAAAAPKDRLFFALFPTGSVASEIRSRQAELCLRHRLRSKPLAEERLHVTLFHLGDYAGLPKDVVARALSAATNLTANSFEVTFDLAGSFSGRSRNRPFVLRGGPGVVELEGFQSTLGVELAKSGLGKWARPYTPHVTLTYSHSEIPTHAIEPVAWRVAEFVLVHSLLGQTRHIRLASWDLR